MLATPPNGHKPATSVSVRSMQSKCLSLLQWFLIGATINKTHNDEAKQRAWTKNQAFFLSRSVNCVMCSMSPYLFLCNLRRSVFSVFLFALNGKNPPRIGINAQLWPQYDYFIVNMLQDLIDMSIRRKIEWNAFGVCAREPHVTSVPSPPFHFLPHSISFVQICMNAWLATKTWSNPIDTRLSSYGTYAIFFFFFSIVLPRSISSQVFRMLFASIINVIIDRVTGYHVNVRTFLHICAISRGAFCSRWTLDWHREYWKRWIDMSKSMWHFCISVWFVREVFCNATRPYRVRTVRILHNKYIARQVTKFGQN